MPNKITAELAPYGGDVTPLGDPRIRFFTRNGPMTVTVTDGGQLEIIAETGRLVVSPRAANAITCDIVR